MEKRRGRNTYGDRGKKLEEREGRREDRQGGNRVEKDGSGWMKENE